MPSPQSNHKKSLPIKEFGGKVFQTKGTADVNDLRQGHTRRAWGTGRGHQMEVQLAGSQEVEGEAGELWGGPDHVGFKH